MKDLEIDLLSDKKIWPLFLFGLGLGLVKFITDLLKINGVGIYFIELSTILNH